MIEIDRSTINAAPPDPEPAKPILASQLLELEKRQRTRFTRCGRPERLSTGCAEIDERLGGGGVERGIVVGISSGDGDGRLISLNLLASIILSHLPISTDTAPKAVATIIDSTGSFPLALLAKLLRSRVVKARASFHPPHKLANEEADLDTEVQRCLEMVGISRVFDVEGLWEVLGEVRTTSRSAGEEIKSERDREAGRKEDEKEKQSTLAEAEVADSEDDESSLSPTEDIPVRREKVDEGIEIIIVDNMTHIINEMFSRKEKTDAHTLLTLLSQTLTSFTRASNILTILHNTTVPSKTPSNPSTTANNNDPFATASTTYYNPPNPYDQPHHQQHHQQQHRLHNNPSSLFPSNPIKPALGQIFTQLPSLHLLLSSLPKTTRDAELLYGGGGGGGGLDEVGPHTDAGKITYCTVLEILKDETPKLSTDAHNEEQGRQVGGFAEREGSWCAVEADSEDETTFRSAFEEKDGMRGLAMERDRVRRVLGEEIGKGEKRLGGEGGDGVAGAERLTGRGVSNVAKAYGFGGRRV